jgi:hypothetical protein
MRWVKFSERFPGSKDQASLDIDDDVIIKSDDTFLVRNWSQLLNVVSLDDEWLEIIEAEPVKECKMCIHFCIAPALSRRGTCRKNPPTDEGFPITWDDAWCSHFEPK